MILTIKRKLQLSTFILIITTALVGLVIWQSNMYIAHQTSNIKALESGTMYLQKMLRGINEIIITEGMPDSVALAKSGLTGFNGIHDKLMDLGNNTYLTKRLNNVIDPKWQSIKKRISPFLIVNLDTESDELMVTYGRLIKETDLLLEEVLVTEKELEIIIAASSKRAQYIAASVVTVILLSIAAFFKLLYTSISKPIDELSNLSEGFGNGDLCALMNDSRKDEFGILASHLNRAIMKLNKMISNVKQYTNTLASNTEGLSASITQIAGNAREQSAQTTQAAAATEELNASFQEVARNSLDATDSAKTATSIALKGGEVVSKTVEDMTMIAETVKDSSHSIQSLGDNSKRIGDIVSVISDIAEQTNLLALNAAIEAARAGEQGRGFAVVADEVRKLAEKTSSATNEIVDMIQTIQEDTGRAVKAMEEGTAIVETGVISANNAGESLKQIVDSSHNVTDMIQQIATAAEEQSSTGQEIASSIEFVAGLTQQTAEGTMDSSESTKSLSKLAQDLNRLVSEFKLNKAEAIVVNGLDYQLSEEATVIDNTITCTNQ